MIFILTVIIFISTHFPANKMVACIQSKLHAITHNSCTWLAQTNSSDVLLWCFCTVYSKLLSAVPSKCSNMGIMELDGIGLFKIQAVVVVVCIEIYSILQH